MPFKLSLSEISPAAIFETNDAIENFNKIRLHKVRVQTEGYSPTPIRVWEGVNDIDMITTTRLYRIAV